MSERQPQISDRFLLVLQICVLATGSTYGAPMRMIADSTSSAKEALRSLQRKIKDAQRIVLVGGGTVGIEFAGEILDRSVVRFSSDAALS